MSFRIVRGQPTHAEWMATDGSSTYYIGQIVAYSAASKAATVGTVVPLAVPAGVADTTNFQVIAGIVVGTSNRTPSVDTTLGDKITGVITQANQLARDWTGNEGMYIKGDPQALVQVAPITPETIIEGPIYNAAYGTAPTVVSDTAGTDTTGYTTAGTTGACDFGPKANICSIYCRSGANRGIIRTTNDNNNATLTAPDTTVAFPYDVALGDTFVRVPLKHGLSHIYIAGPGMYIDCSKPASGADFDHTFQVVVHKLDLAEARKERAQFRFMPTHFDYARA